MEVLLQYIRQAEDGLSDIYRRLGSFPPPPPAEIQRDIANVVVLLYGLRRNGSPATEPHPLVFASKVEERQAMKAAAG